ncbi:hypothetical protein THAR02_06969 [Trichoderma harzianum]|uniref:Uncharacterized protein n=1 Tax=Trichoderma harzianum TaxID=5544 RepID=A0A0F9X6T5_TRIHA|nr:hypothetical protein THAR02_06969 [Trichoderma harzianum]
MPKNRKGWMAEDMAAIRKYLGEEAKHRGKRRVEDENYEEDARRKNRRTYEKIEEEAEDTGSGRWAGRTLNESGVGSVFEDDRGDNHKRDDEDDRRDDEHYNAAPILPLSSSKSFKTLHASCSPAAPPMSRTVYIMV